MPVTCPNCRSVIPAEDVELSTRLAKCRACDEVFALDVPAAAAPRVPVVLPPLPAGVSVTDDGFTRALRFRWFTPVAVFLVFFCVVWDGFLVSWYAAVFGFGKGGEGASVFMSVFPLLHVAVGVGLTYYTLCLFVNRTTLTVGDSLAVRHGPLPWPGGVTLPAEAVRAVYCEEVVRTGKRGPRVSFAVKAVTADGREVTVLSGLDSLPRAKFFELQLEEWLGLPPTAVPGEAG